MMFESLDEHIKHDQALESTLTARVLRWVAAAVVTTGVLLGLYWLIKMVD